MSGHVSYDDYVLLAEFGAVQDFRDVDAMMMYQMGLVAVVETLTGRQAIWATDMDRADALLAARGLKRILGQSTVRSGFGTTHI